MKQRSPWLLVIILSLVPLLMVLGNSILIPGMPEMQSKMHATKLQVSLLITMFSVPAGIVIPFAGFLSDRIGRKWVIVPSMLLFGIGGLVAGFASWWVAKPYTLVLVGRVIQGIGASGTAPIAMAFLGDLFQGEMRSKALGVNEAGNAFGKVISPILGAAVALIAWFAVFFIFPVLCVPLAAAVWWLVPENNKSEAKTQSVTEYFEIISLCGQTRGTLAERRLSLWCNSTVYIVWSIVLLVRFTRIEIQNGRCAQRTGTGDSTIGTKHDIVYYRRTHQEEKDPHEVVAGQRICCTCRQCPNGDLVDQECLVAGRIDVRKRHRHWTCASVFEHADYLRSQAGKQRCGDKFLR